MKYLNTKERRALRAEWVYMHRVELLALDYKYRNIGAGKKPKDERAEWIKKIREEIGYSDTTLDCDIWLVW